MSLHDSTTFLYKTQKGGPAAVSPDGPRIRPYGQTFLTQSLPSGGPPIAVDHMDPATWPNPFTPSKTKDLLRGARLADSEIAKTTEYKPLPEGEWLAVPPGTARIR